MTDVNLAKAVIDAATKNGIMVATAESCTGGMIAAALTDVAGSSAVFERGFVTYSNAAKMACLGVPEGLIVENGAVSEPVARAMAEGALSHAPVQASIAVTGIAGPGGGTQEKPVGLVHIAVATPRGTTHQKCLFASSHNAKTRADIRRLTVETALDMLLKQLS
ncbi:MAG: CinA family protein [Pseudomonadota bacterium]